MSQTEDIYDIIIIGSGCAGLTLALTLAETASQIKIALVSKAKLTDGNSFYAQGGIATATDTTDSFGLHLKDTLNCGCGLSRQSVAREIIFGSEQAINFLQRMGVDFDRDGSGALIFGHEAGHSRRRILHCADHTGNEIIRKLLQSVITHQNITLFEDMVAIDVLNQHTDANCLDEKIIGAKFLDTCLNQVRTLFSKATVLATGGTGKAFRYTTNSDVATGDGLAMAHRAGAKIINLEYYQFHPTLLYHAKSNNFLLTEALRGEGAYLVDAKHQQRFMQKHDKRLELATRDVVSRAIHQQILSDGHEYVYMDVRHFDQAYFQARFPSIFNKLQACDINPAKDLIPVVPAAHYQCGGIETQLGGQTSLRGLYAIGEVACTGLHGANRLASNSLLECIVSAQRCAAELCNTVRHAPPLHTYSTHHAPVQINTDQTWPAKLWQSLRYDMTTYAGIVRDEAGLRHLMLQLNTLSKKIKSKMMPEVIDRKIIELKNMHEVAGLIAKSALNNTVSAGCHFRRDSTLFLDQNHVN